MLLSYQLSLPATRVLDELLFLFQARKNRGVSVYLTCGRQYLARKTGYSIRSITRATNELCQLGLITKDQRRQIGEKWQTNLYQPTTKLWKWVRARLEHFRVPILSQQPLRVDSFSYQKGKKGEGKAKLGELLADFAQLGRRKKQKQE